MDSWLLQSSILLLFSAFDDRNSNSKKKYCVSDFAIAICNPGLVMLLHPYNTNKEFHDYTKKAIYLITLKYAASRGDVQVVFNF